MSSENEIDRLKVDAFDSTFVLSSIFILILFNVLEESMNCDVQRMIKNNQYIKHIVGLVSIFFLFTTVGNKKSKHIISLWGKTIVTYFIFLLLAKSKWYFSLPVAILLLLEQSLKIQEYHNIDNSKDYNKKIYVITRNIITYSIFILIFTGAIDIGIKQYNDHKDNFNFFKLFFGIGCQHKTLD